MGTVEIKNTNEVGVFECTYTNNENIQRSFKFSFKTFCFVSLEYDEIVVTYNDIQNITQHCVCDMTHTDIILFKQKLANMVVENDINYIVDVNVPLYAAVLQHENNSILYNLRNVQMLCECNGYANFTNGNNVTEGKWYLAKFASCYGMLTISKYLYEIMSKSLKEYVRI